MQITDSTRAYQIAELMGAEVDELDGRILLGLLSRECVTDTDELSDAAWLALVDEAAAIRAREYTDDDQ